MIRTKHTRTGPPTLILTSDWHLREDQPVCRTDNHLEAQLKKILWISQLQAQHKCPVIHAGDLFHHWKPSPGLLSDTMKVLPDSFFTIYGQHDLPQHNLDLVKKCGIYTLLTAGKLTVLPSCSWGQPVDAPSLKVSGKNILVWHKYNYQGKLPWPDCPDPAASLLLRQYPQFDLIVTGDNHKPFVEEFEGRILVNPGSIMRQTTDQIDHQPRVYLWYAETNSVDIVYLPIEKDVISREHIAVIEERDARISAFVEQLKTNYTTTLSFEDNLEEFKKINKVDENVMKIIYKAIEA